MTTQDTGGIYYVSALKPQARTQPEPYSISNVKPWISGKHIIVAGAGMSGLAFAIALSRLFPPNHPLPTLTIYERDSYENRVGREGYTLSLRTDARSGGIQILDQLGLYESCRDVSVTHVSRMSFWKNDFSNALLRVSVGPVGPKGLMAMRIRRNALQKVLADKVQEYGWDIQWETAVIGAQKVQKGEREEMRVTLSSGKTIPCDILIAADGARSKILATLRPNATLTYAGVTMVLGTGRFSSPESIPKPLDTDYGTVLGGSGTGLFVSPVDETSALWSFSYYDPQPCESLRCPMSAEQEESLMGKARMLAKNFDPPVLTLVNATDSTSLMCFPAMHRTPFSHKPSTPLKSSIPVIYIGDANHAVSPYAGNGANMAIIDGWDLASSLTTGVHCDSIERAIAEYDSKSMPRAQATLQMSLWSIDVAHARGWKLWVYMMVATVMRWVAKWRR